MAQTVRKGAVIAGLTVLDDFIAPDNAESLLEAIDAEPWRTDPGQRNTQHFGWSYDYLKRTLSPAAAIPYWAALLGQRLQDERIFDSLPNQIIVNDYAPNTGIAAHIDHVQSFGPVVASLSLNSHCVMNFRRGSKTAPPIPILLEPRSLLVLRDAARFEWFHDIPESHVHYFGNSEIVRGRRVSLTFRTANGKR